MVATSNTGDCGIGEIACDTYNKVADVSVAVKHTADGVDDLRHRFFDLNNKINDIEFGIERDKAMKEAFGGDFCEVHKEEKKTSKKKEAAKKEETEETNEEW